MYENWQVKRWETPISDYSSIQMLSLKDDGKLNIKLQIIKGKAGGKRFSITFKNYLAYRNILEEYRLELWNKFTTNDNNLGPTWIVSNSPWINELESNEPLLKEFSPQLIHYVVCTEDDVIEVLSNDVPIITELRPSKSKSNKHGKSKIYYHPEDREEIEKILNKYKGKK
jgi:hypothetical protein